MVAPAADLIYGYAQSILSETHFLKNHLDLVLLKGFDNTQQAFLRYTDE